MLAQWRPTILTVSGSAPTLLQHDDEVMLELPMATLALFTSQNGTTRLDADPGVGAVIVGGRGEAPVWAKDPQPREAAPA